MSCVAGQIFDEWTLIKEVEPVQRPNSIRVIFDRRWLCKCNCGTEKIVYQSNLINKTSKSCGCRKTRILKKNFVTHGKTGTYLHKAWNSIKRRCFNKNQKGYKYYGGRGINLFQPWQNSFIEFESYIISTLGHRPTENHTLDRKNNNGNYEPGNLRWATQKEQNRNQRRNHLIIFKNVTLTLSQWSEKTGIPKSTLTRRFKLNWSKEKALTTPVKPFRNRPEIIPDFSWLDLMS